jgi:hypothetical protein
VGGRLPAPEATCKSAFFPNESLDSPQPPRKIGASLTKVGKSGALPTERLGGVDARVSAKALA